MYLTYFRCFFPFRGRKPGLQHPIQRRPHLLLRPRLPHRADGIEHAASGVLRLDGAPARPALCGHHRRPRLRRLQIGLPRQLCPPARCTWVIISVTFEKVYNPCASRAVTRIFKVSIALANPYSSSL